MHQQGRHGTLERVIVSFPVSTVLCIARELAQSHTTYYRMCSPSAWRVVVLPTLCHTKVMGG
jgi:hypothetical protein